MAFREAVAAKAFDLLEGPFRKFPLVAALDHTFDHLVLETADPAGEFERRHRPAQRVRLRRRETGPDDRDLHRLFLEEGDSQRLFEHRSKLLLWIFGYF